MEHTKILERIKKLLALATSDNVNEAANAAAQAQRLMTEHRIADAELAEVSEQEQFEDQLLDQSGQRISNWKISLGMALCHANGCQMYTNRKAGMIRMAGKPSNTQIVAYLFSYLVGEVTRLSEASLLNRIADVATKTWSNNFKHGAAAELSERIRQAYATTLADAVGTNNSAALVLVRDEHKKADAWLHERMTFRQVRSKRTVDEDAYAAGRRAGSKISLSPAKGSLGKGTRGSLCG